MNDIYSYIVNGLTIKLCGGRSFLYVQPFYSAQILANAGLDICEA